MDITDLDSLDRKIVAFLQDDGRMPFREIARRLGVSEGTVRRRYNRMVEGGLLEVVATGDPMKFGIAVDAVTLIKTRPGEAEAVAKALTQLDEVRYVGLGIGSADVVIESLHPSIDELYRFLSQAIPAIEGITAHETIQIVRIFKSTWDWRAWLKRQPALEGGEIVAQSE